MPKYCVFCGEKPESKTKEHVLPKWLVKLTGNPKRKAVFGFPDKELKYRKFAFDQFTFPACNLCNNKYSALEADAKIVISRILTSETITTEETSILLDWLDKVRVGVWLGHLQLDKYYYNADPNFYIGARIGQFDRMLIVDKVVLKEKRLNLAGTDTYSFAQTPSAFTLMVNNYIFTNISFMFLVSKNLGFPYPSKVTFIPDSKKLKIRMVGGKERITRPLVRKTVPKRSIIIYQPMFPGNLIEDRISGYETGYVRSHSLNCNMGVGNIFLEQNGKLKEFKAGSRLLLSPGTTINNKKYYIESAIEIIKWQKWLDNCQKRISLEKLTNNRKKEIKNEISAKNELSNIRIKYYKKFL